MPELPEVETIARSLRVGSAGPALPGRRIERIRTRWPRHFREPALTSFRRRISGQVVQNVIRRGKYLVFPLEGETMLIHLRMSGDLRLAPTVEARQRFEHTLFQLDNGWDLRFSDARKFGRISLLRDPTAFLNRLGPEPLGDEFTPQALGQRLSQHKRMLKPLLLDQAFIAGIGNIYADETLHLARLHPLRRSDTLDPQEVVALWEGIRKALEDGLLHNGASIDWVYRGGDYQHHFHVYGRAGEACYVCGSPIMRTVVGQRGTHFCPECQPEVQE
jgi:formamidopyrimidine-DNA glycosylase